MKKKKLFILALLAVFALIALCACGDKKKDNKTTPKSQSDMFEDPSQTPEPTKEESTKAPEPTKTEESNTPTAEPADGPAVNELSGEPIDEKYLNKRPVAVMYNNIKDGLPHYGIGQAEIVYEAYVEGGITRMLGIFKKYDEVKEYGSIRSTRAYYVSFAREYNAVLSHFGGPHIYVDEDLKKIDRLDGQLTSDVYFKKEGRVAPHNAFGSGDGFVKGFEKYNISTDYTKEYKGQHFTFADADAPVTNEGGVSAVKVTPGYVYNKPYLIYNEETGLYEKYQFGEADTDGNDGKQLTYKNIIIQYADQRNLDNSYYLGYNLITSGKTGWYITNGKAVPITWKKEADGEITRYYDEAGKEIVLNPGSTYICLYPDGQKGLTKFE